MQWGFLIFLAGIIFGSFPVSSAAEPAARQDKELEKISVTASRLERKTADVPASVAVVQEEAIKDTKMFNLKEALNSTPGVQIDTRNQGYDSRLIIRGAGLKASYGIRDIMVLLDGVPITDPDSFTRLDFIDTQLIEQIEVVKGPNSTLWGANASGGVINITSKSPLERSGGMLKLGVGNFDTRNYHLSYSSDFGEKLFYTVSGSRRQSDNSWRRWNEFWTNQVSFQPSYVFEDGSTLETNLSYTKASLQLPGSQDSAMYEEYRNTGKAMETEGPWQFSGRYSEVFYFSSKFTKTIGKIELKPLLYGNIWTHHHPVTGRINDADTLTYGGDLQANYRHSLFGMGGIATTGVALRYDDQATDYYKYLDFTTVSPFSIRIREVLSDKRGDHIEREKRRALLWGVYLQESIHPSESVIIDLGIRYDEIEFDIKGSKTADFSWASGGYVDCPSSQLTHCGDYRIKKTYNAFSPRVAATIKLTDMLNLFGNISTGIQTPTESEFSDNPALKLVETQNFEVGLKARHFDWNFDSSFYYTPVKNEVVRVVQASGQTEYINAGETLKKGFEWIGSYALLPGFHLGASYSYTDYTFEEFSEPVRVGPTTENRDRKGNSLPFIPEHQYSLFVRYQHSTGLKCKVQSFSWGEYYMDNANTETYPGYDFVTNLMLGYQAAAVDLTLNVENVFDQRYSVETKKDTAGEITYTPAAPRSVMVRLAYHF